MLLLPKQANPSIPRTFHLNAERRISAEYGISSIESTNQPARGTQKPRDRLEFEIFTYSDIPRALEKMPLCAVESQPTRDIHPIPNLYHHVRGGILSGTK
jgi:hypothetical protein